MKIYVFERNGFEGADYKLPFDAKLKRVVDVPNRRAADKLLKRETGRIYALLERAKTELPVEVEQTLLGRIVSLFKRG